MFKFHKYYFALTLLLFSIELIIGCYFHDDFIRPYAGDFLIVIFLYCLVKSFADTPIFPTAIAVLLFSYGIETLQYFNFVQLIGLEQYELARIIIGTSFAWIDILAYTLGTLLVLAVENQRKNINRYSSYSQ